MDWKASVFSDWEPLKVVFVHRPGVEFLNLDPNYLSEFLFEDTPYLHAMQREHDRMVHIMRSKGIFVLDPAVLITNLIQTNPQVKNSLILGFLKYLQVTSQELAMVRTRCRDYLSQVPTNQLIDILMSGIKRSQLDVPELSHNFYLTPPLVNFIFQRDVCTFIGNFVVICSMYYRFRQPETLILNLVLTHHPWFRDIPKIRFNPEQQEFVEGGDILILNSKTILVGCGQRTSAAGITSLANQILNLKTSFKKIVKIRLKNERSFMHLDTVLTRVNHNTFLVYDDLFSHAQFKITEITAKGEFDVSLSLFDYLEQELSCRINVVSCGGKQPIQKHWEQWNDGCNVFALSSREVIAYERNWTTNQLLLEQDIKVIEINASELSRGRGGPRCLCMPICRQPF